MREKGIKMEGRGRIFFHFKMKRRYNIIKLKVSRGKSEDGTETTKNE